MDSINYPPPSPFKCPAIRTNDIIEGPFQERHIGGKDYFIIENSYNVSDAEDHKISQFHHLRLLFRCNNEEGEQNDIYCKACESDKIGTTYYFCNECDKCYHKECVESPPIYISPYHPKYPLQLHQSSECVLYDTEACACHSCGRLVGDGLFYYSSSCHLILDPICARKREYPAINNPKRHEHILHYLPRKASLTCDVCGSDDNKYCFYVCHQCDFIVHITCIYLPRIILISSHNHRLSYTSSLPSGNWICRLCRRKIDENCGEYSCTKGCGYTVHTKCATHYDVWDGRELEGQPEMVYGDIKSFEEIGDGTIRHFSHAEHHMRLDEDIGRVYDRDQHCQACVLPLYDSNVYICMQCDFALHKTCANLPRLKQIVMHRHQFILKPSSDTGSSFRCFCCKRNSCGFKYACYEGCKYSDLDVRCASLSELVDHQSHPHPLFYRQENYQTCSICGGKTFGSLSCVEYCDFFLCSCCATLPDKVKHEHDDHMLTLSYEKSASGLYWCQVCEETTNPKKGYYECNGCGVTFHIECALGIDNPYVKARQTIKFKNKNIEIIPNNRFSRLMCNECHRRCQYRVAYKTPAGNIICSLGEIDRGTR